MHYYHLHTWPADISQARELQRTLQKEIIFSPVSKLPKRIAGADIAYSPGNNMCYAAVIVFNSVDGEIIEEKYISEKINFPYIPSYLSFREVPPLLNVFSQINSFPELLFIDGHGYAHPRNLGLASHLGLWLNVPTIGIAKKKLVGSYEEPIGEQGNFSYLINNRENIGAVLRTKRNTKPVFVSCGYKIDLESAIRLTLEVCDGYRIPYPTRVADRLVGKYKKDCLADG